MGLIVAAVWAGSAPPSRADVVHVVAVHDNTLFQDANGATSDGAGPVLFAGNIGQNLTRRALVRFDVSRSVPTGATVDSVELTIQVSATPNATERLFGLHRVLRNWGEGTSYATGGTGAPATPMDATWTDTFFPDSVWAHEGGDFVTTASATLGITGLGSYTWSGAGMVSDVQAWLSDPSTDFGWLVQGDESGPSTVRRFESRESDSTARRPMLTVYFTNNELAREPLGPVFPNPTRGVAWAHWDLANPADGAAWIEDVAGRRVASVLEGPVRAGRHDLRWGGRTDDGHRAAPGIYVWRVAIAGRLVGSRRFALIW